MKKILHTLLEQKTLPQQEAYEVLHSIANHVYHEVQVTAFINVFMMRKISVEELIGFRNALMDLAIQIDLEDRKCLDIVGTGGDGKDSFNISTLSCFVAAGAGAWISKHGNYAASSVSGASNVMEYFGYRHSNDAHKIKKELDKYHLTFLHAPLFHPALKSVSHIRKNLQLRTFFNLLGPLVNPCQPIYNFIGIYNLEVMRLYHYALQSMDKNYTLIHSLDGYDEVSLTADTKVITPSFERIYSCSQLSSLSILPQHLYGGRTIEDAAKLFLSVLENRALPEQKEVVIVNTAFALMQAELSHNFNEAKQMATESLESLKAYQVFKQIMENQA